MQHYIVKCCKKYIRGKLRAPAGFSLWAFAFIPLKGRSSYLRV